LPERAGLTLSHEEEATYSQVLAANRSEIAIRIFRAANELECAPSPSTLWRIAWPCIASRPMKPTRWAPEGAGRGAWR